MPTQEEIDLIKRMHAELEAECKAQGFTLDEFLKAMSKETDTIQWN